MEESNEDPIATNPLLNTVTEFPKPMSARPPEHSKQIEFDRAMCAEAAVKAGPALTKKEIIYEDEWMIAVNKPSGVYCEHVLSSIPDLLVSSPHHTGSKNDAISLELHLANRLDRDTSGVMVITKRHRIAGKLVKAFTDRKVRKTYLALCIGPVPKWSEIYVESGHGRSKFGAWRVYSRKDVGRTLPGGSVVREMTTRLKVLSVNGNQRMQHYSFEELQNCFDQFAFDSRDQFSTFEGNGLTDSAALQLLAKMTRNTKFFKQQLQKIIKCCIQAGVPSPSQFPTNVSYEVRIEGKDRTIYNVYSLGPKNVVEIKLDSRWFEPKKPEAPIAMEKRSLKRKRENVPDSRRRKGYQKMQRINGPNSRKRVTNADNIQPRQQEEDCNGDPHGEGEEPTNDNNMDFISDKGNHDAEGEYQEPIEDMNSRPTYTLALRVKYYIARYSLFQIFGHHLDWQRLLQDVESNIADLEWDFCGQIFPLLDDEDDGGHGNKFKFPCDEEDGDHGDNFLFPDEEEDGDQGGDDNHNDEDEGRKIIEDIDDDLEEEEEEEEEKDTNSVNSDGSVSEEDTSCLPADWLPQEEDEDQEEDDDEEEEEDEDDDDDDDNEDDDDDDDNNEDEDIFGLMTPKFSLCLPPHVAEDEEWCSICQNSNPEVDESLNPLLLPCSHAYHPECITKWLASKNSCPLCRFKVSDKWNKASSRS